MKITDFSPLYEAVQTSGIFPDSKHFPDCTPRRDVAEILAAYEQARLEPDFDLKAFVQVHFEAPPVFEGAFQSGQKPIDEHLRGLWQTLLRQPNDSPATPDSSLIPLPNSYIVPGGRFREVYYWDSYFTMLGLQVSGRVDIIESMVDNFAYLIDAYGHIPNGNRTYYLSRSQPPFFALMVSLLAEIRGEQILLHYRQALEKEYAFWMDGEHAADLPTHRRLVRLPDGSLLNRYWDDDPQPRPEAYAEDLHIARQSGKPAAEVYRNIRAAAESGWDFSSRWFADGHDMATIQTVDIVPVDLNCLLYFLEKTLVHTYRQLPDHTPVEVMRDRAKRRKAAILEHCWDAETGFFFDYNFVEKKISSAATLAGIAPLFFEIAETEQAARAADFLEKNFLRPGGLVSTLVHTGQQWDAPNGWAPLQWLAVQGLRNYGFHDLADTIRRRWMELNEKTYAATGKMMEKYNVEDLSAPGGGGEYPNQDGFGWTNGVYLKMIGSM